MTQPPTPDQNAIDLSELLSLVSIYVTILARADPEFHGRLVVWALQVLQAEGRSVETLLSKLEKSPTPPRQWWLLRQFTPVALHVLLRHLQAALLTFEMSYAAKTDQH